jgi:hypothetical protein
MSTELRDFRTAWGDKPERLNFKGKKQRRDRLTSAKVQEDCLKYLTDEKAN